MRVSTSHGSSVIRPLSWAPCWACDLHVGASPSRVIHTSLDGVLMASAALLVPITSISPSPRRHIRELSSRHWLLGESLPMPYAVDTCSSARLRSAGLCPSCHRPDGQAVMNRLRAPVSTTQGYSVPHHRLPLCVGPHSSPGFSGVSLRRLHTRSALIRALLAVANNPRRLLHANDDSIMGSCTYPCTALLDGIPSRILSDRLLSPLLGLMVSRYPRGYAFTSTPEGQELHLHGDEVIKDHSISAPYPPEPL